MTDDDLLNLFLSYHKERLLSFAYSGPRKRFGVPVGFEDAEEGLNDALRELAPKIVAHFREVAIEDQSNVQKAVLPSLWILIIYRAIDAHRKSKRHTHPLGQPTFSEDKLNEQAANADDTSEAAKDTLARLLVAAMNKLSAIEKQVLQLTELQEPEITTLEAAQKLGKSPGMVKTTRYRAFKKLRAEAQLQNSR